METVNGDNVEKAILVSAILSDDDLNTFDELKELAKTDNLNIVGTIKQERRSIDRNYYIGKGKLNEIKEYAKNAEANVVIFNDELSGSQIKNIEDILEIKVVDRTNLILDIFSKRAKSREGSLQVELAQLNYRLPRLIGIGKELSRLGGGIGTRGPGETKLETDRRYIEKRIKSINNKIEEMKKHRNLQRVHRKKNRVQVVAIIGYTNSGKSTLLNVLTDSNVYVENKLFATLDPTARKLILPSGHNVILIDTVGFIKRLPHELIEAFKSTLEESKYADILLHVIDATANDVDGRIKVVENVLDSLDSIDKPIINVMNKSDLLEIIPRNTDDTIYISAKTKYGLDALLRAIDNLIRQNEKIIDFFIKYESEKEYIFLRENSEIISEEYTNGGIKVRALVEDVLIKKLKRFIIS